MQKISFLVNYNLYESKREFTKKLAEALNQQGIETQIFDANEGPLMLTTVKEIQDFAPDFTCSFNSLFPLSEDKFLWDFLKIPHISFLVDPLMYSMHLLKSPYSLLTVVDRNDIREAGPIGSNKLFFFPHAVAGDVEPGDPNRPRPYDVVFLGTCYDYDSLQASWRSDLEPKQVQVLETAIDIVYRDNRASLANALALAINQLQADPRQIDFHTLFYYLDNYTRGRDRVELIRSIRHVPVHIFGELSQDNAVGFLGWKEYLHDQSNVVFHPSVPFQEGIEVQKQAKICLNSMPFFRDGTHERIFTGLACGAVPITSESLYLREQFVDGQDLFFYQSPRFEAVEPVIQDLLKDEKKRQKIAQKGREKVMAAHTWDHRASTFKATFTGVAR